MNLPTAPDGLSAPQLRSALRTAEDLVVSDGAEAVRVAQALEGRARELGETALIAQALCIRAGGHFFRSRHRAAGQLYRAVLRLDGVSAHPAVQARALNGLGNVAVVQGETAAAMTHYLESAQLAISAGDSPGWQRAMNNVGLVHVRFGDHAEALRLYQELMQLAGDAGEPLAESSNRTNLVMVHVEMGQFAEALFTARAYLANRRFRSYRLHRMIVQVYLARAHLGLNDPERALRRLRVAEPGVRELGDQELLTKLLITRGQTLMALGAAGPARTALDLALARAVRLGFRPQESEAHAALAALLEAQDDCRAALEHLRRHYALEREMQSENVEQRLRLTKVYGQLSSLQQDMEHARWQAEHDALTRLPNRLHFLREGESRLKQATGHSAVMFIDLDGFKEVNDTFGHATGDEVLVQLAARLLQTLRPGDLVARLAGDEFTVLLTNLPGPEAARSAATRLLSVLERPYDLPLAESGLQVQPSLGMVCVPSAQLDLRTMLRQADQAMYTAKRGGGGAATFAAPPP